MRRKLTYDRRAEVEVLRKEGRSWREIADRMGVHHSNLLRALIRWYPADKVPIPRDAADLRSFLVEIVTGFDTSSGDPGLALTGDQRVAIEKFVAMTIAWRSAAEARRR